MFNSRTRLAILGIGLLAFSASLSVGKPQNDTPEDLFRRAEELRSDNNFKDAADLYRKVLSQKTTNTSATANLAKSIVGLQLCMRRLGDESQLDSDLAQATETFGKNFRVLAQAAETLMSATHAGVVADSAFSRGYGRRRGGIQGTYISCTEQDRLQAIRWLRSAITLAQESGLEASHPDLARCYLQLAKALLLDRNYQFAWRLQTLTDLDLEPNYTDLNAQMTFASLAAPVDEDSAPILHATPESFDAAKSDGERMRWALEQAALGDGIGADAKVTWADFLHSQFSVDTLQQDAWIFRGQPKEDGQSGIQTLHTLSDNETVAKLASGIQRFELPDEFNPLTLYLEIARSDRSTAGIHAADSVFRTYLNRRQYSKAADFINEHLERAINPGYWRQQLENIRNPRVQFDPTRPLLAGTSTSLSLIFRNATQIQFTARRVDIEKLLAATKAHFRSGQPLSQSFDGRRNRGLPDLNSPNSLFTDQAVNDYLIDAPQTWTEQVEPRANHWDRRIQANTPLKTAGLYLIDAAASDDGQASTQHRSRTLIWIQDTVVLRKPMGEKALYQLLDAESGEPIQAANFEFFGWRYDNNNGQNRNRIVSKNFAERSDEQGLVEVALDNQFQWMSVARSNDGRLALLGFEGFYGYRGIGAPEQYLQAKAFGVSDRPIYRPGEKVQTKFWVAYPAYGDLDAPRVANTNLSISVFNGKRDRVASQNVTTDEYGGCEFEFELPQSATLGYYTFEVRRSEPIQRALPRPKGRLGLRTDPRGGMGMAANLGQNFETSLRVRVEEYRKPEFEVNILAPSKPIALGETIEARIQAKYYFGAPVSDANVSVKVQRTIFNDSFYPAAPYDWCYGSGYWWFTEDYPWYPGWKGWCGCIAPFPWWMGNSRFEPPELVLEQNLKLDATGEAVISIDSALAKELFGDSEDHRYQITAEVRDASRRTIVAQGEVVAARQAFKIYTWLDRGFYNVGDRIEANFQARMLDRTSVVASGKLDLLRISYDTEGTPTERLVQSWDAATNENGSFVQVLSANQPGQYRLRARLSDGAGHEVEGAYIFTVRGITSDAQGFRYSAIELTPDRAEYAVGDIVRLQIAADRANATVMLFERPSGGIYRKPKLIRLDGKSTVVEIQVEASDQPNFFVEAYVVYDGKVHQKTREIFVPPAERVLKVEVAANKTDYLPGEEAEVSIKVTDPTGKPVSGSCTIAAYDRSLEQLASDILPPDIREFFWKWRRTHYPQVRHNLQFAGYPIPIKGIPGWSFLGMFGSTLADDLDATEDNESVAGLENDFSRRTRGMGGGMGGYGGAMEAMPASAPAMNSMAMMDGVAESAADKSGGAANEPEITVRKDFADSALWLASVDTDSQGEAVATFKMPENLTSWKIRSWAIGQGTRVGSADAEAVTRKPLLVRLQTPRFLIERDEVVLSTIVHNDLATTKTVQVKLEIIGETSLELMPGAAAEQTVTIKPHEQARVDWNCQAISEGNVTVRTSARTDGASDAMQLEFPIVVHGILKTDSWAGTVRDGTEKSSVTIRIPEQRRVEQSSLTIRVSPSLAAAMLDALPYLASYPYGCTEQTLNRFVPTVITQKLLQDMNLDLDAIGARKANLNTQELGEPSHRIAQWRRKSNPVYDSAEVDEMVRTGVNLLTDMQNSDGGWGWFSGTQSVSSPHITATVLRGLLVAQENGVAIVPDVIQRGIRWLSSYQEAELQNLTNAETKQTPYKLNPSNLDALVFQVLVQTGTVNTAMQEVLYEGRQHLSVYGKALLAYATHAVGNEDQTRMLRQNIEQFLTQDAENETAYLNDNTSWWYWYGSDIEASAMYLKLLAAQDPNSTIAPRLVKYLLNNRKHATYWNSTRDTALVVEAFGDYLRATQETLANQSVEVWLGGKRIGELNFTPESLFDTENTINLTGNAVPAGEHLLEIRRKGTGNLYWNVYSTNFTQEDDITEAGLEVKISRRYYALVPTKTDITLAGSAGNVLNAQQSSYDRIEIAPDTQLKSGQLVEVELLVESKNDYEYILIEDRRAASLESVETASGYFFSAGLSIYREFREQHVGLCIERLPRGKYSIRYQLRSEAPGRFTALPAQIEGMYSPELVGNSRDQDFRVVDEE